MSQHENGITMNPTTGEIRVIPFKIFFFLIFEKMPSKATVHDNIFDVHFQHILVLVQIKNDKRKPHGSCNKLHINGNDL